MSSSPLVRNVTGPTATATGAVPGGSPLSTTAVSSVSSSISSNPTSSGFLDQLQTWTKSVAQTVKENTMVQVAGLSAVGLLAGWFLTNRLRSRPPSSAARTVRVQELNGDEAVDIEAEELEQVDTQGLSNEDNDLLTDEELNALILEQYETLLKSKNTSDEAVKEVYDLVSQLYYNPSYSSDTKYSAAKFLILYHKVHVLASTSREEHAARLQKQFEDFHQVWEYLNSPPDEHVLAADALKLNVATELRDLGKMNAAFEAIFARGQSRIFEENLLLFTRAPYLGKWDAFAELGKLYTSTHIRALDNFHTAGLRRPDVPDYVCILHILEKRAEYEWKNHPKAFLDEASISELEYATYRLESMRRKLVKVEGNRPSHLEIMKQELKANDEKLVEVALPSTQSFFIRRGGVVQTISLSSFPLPMTGIMTTNNMAFECFIDLQYNLENERTLRPSSEVMNLHHEEGYHAERISGDNWQGMYSIAHHPTGKNPAWFVKLTFEVEFTLKKVERM